MHTGEEYLLRIGILVITIFFLQCASRIDPFRTEVLFHNARLDREQLSGQSILFLPAINDSSFDSSGVLCADSQAFLLTRLRSDLRGCTREKFERSYMDEHAREGLEGFYGDLIGNDILALQTSDTVWSHMACRYLLTLRVAYGARVRTFEGALLRSARIEAELWDIDSSEVVWWAETRGTERDARTPDSQFLKEAMLHLYKQLPAYRPALNEKHW
ncbi:MAG: hypothetical protein ACOCW2_02785 [Chitinivibrionales bacterium]